MIKRTKTEKDFPVTTPSGTLSSFLKDHAKEFIAGCESFQAEMTEAGFFLSKGPLHLHDLRLARLADTVAAQARGLARAFATWGDRAPPNSAERLVHLELYGDLRQACASILGEVEEAKARPRP